MSLCGLYVMALESNDKRINLKDYSCIPIFDFKADW